MTAPSTTTQPQTQTQTQAQPQTWQIDASHSLVEFSVRHMMVSTAKGRFSDFAGWIAFDPANVSGSSVSVEIQANSVATADPKRDEHLRSADFFDVAKFPDISMVVTSAEGIDGDIVDLRAQLTVKGATAPLPLRTKVTVLDDGAVRLSAQATIDRNDFGVDGNVLGMVVDQATISGDVVFRRG